MAAKSLATGSTMEQEIRRILIVNHGESVEKVFSNNWMKFYDEQWNLKCSRAFSSANYVTFEDGNLPVSLMDRTDGKSNEKDGPLTEIGKVSSLEIGYALGAAGVTSAKIGGFIYCSPAYVAIESAHYIARGIAIAAAAAAADCNAKSGTQPINDDIKLRIENGLFSQIGGGGFRGPLPKWLTTKEIQDGLGRQVDATYVPAVAELPQETIEELYARMKKTVDKLIASVPNKKEQTLLIVGHPATLEGCTRQLYGAPLRRQRDFDGLCRQIPFCASVRMSERSANKWDMSEPLVPSLTYAGNDAYRWEAFGDPSEMRKVLKK